MRWLRSFLHFWYDFIVGDDWRVAAGVVVALAATAVLAHANRQAWWLLPIAVMVLLVSNAASILGLAVLYGAMRRYDRGRKEGEAELARREEEYGECRARVLRDPGDSWFRSNL